MTRKMFSLNDAMRKLKEYQQGTKELEDAHRYAEAEARIMPEMAMVENIKFHFPDAFN